jgi:hypothetical protein
MPLDRAAILAARDLRTEEVQVPEWGGQVLLGEMGALDSVRLLVWWKQHIYRPTPDPVDVEPAISDGPVTTDSPDPDSQSGQSSDPPAFTADELAAVADAAENDMEFKLQYLVRTILDPSTLRPAFTVAEIHLLGAKQRDVLNRLFAAARRLNGDTDEARAETEKNFERTPAPGSGGD